MKAKSIISAVVVLVIFAINQWVPGADKFLNDLLGTPNDSVTETVDHRELNKLITAHQRRQSKVWFNGVDFTVVRILADDTKGSQHQRFLVEHPELPRLLVAHNIDLTERVPLKVGDRLVIGGRYEWNDKGGVIHWTHHDPRGKQPGGWIDHRGRRYQ